MSRRLFYTMPNVLLIMAPASWAAPLTKSERNGPPRSSRAVRDAVQSNASGENTGRAPPWRNKAFARARARPPPFAVAALRRRRRTVSEPLADPPAAVRSPSTTRVRPRRRCAQRGVSLASTWNGDHRSILHRRPEPGRAGRTPSAKRRLCLRKRQVLLHDLARVKLQKPR